MGGIFDFRSAEKVKEDDARYAERIFPRGMQVRDEIARLIAQLCPKSRPQFMMLAYVSGKESVLKLRSACGRDSRSAPDDAQEHAAALRGIAPRRTRLSKRETACALALIFADLAADAGAPMAELSELCTAADAEEAALPKL